MTAPTECHTPIMTAQMMRHPYTISIDTLRRDNNDRSDELRHHLRLHGRVLQSQIRHRITLRRRKHLQYDRFADASTYSHHPP